MGVMAVTPFLQQGNQGGYRGFSERLGARWRVFQSVQASCASCVWWRDVKHEIPGNWKQRVVRRDPHCKADLSPDRPAFSYGVAGTSTRALRRT